MTENTNNNSVGSTFSFAKDGETYRIHYRRSLEDGVTLSAPVGEVEDLKDARAVVRTLNALGVATLRSAIARIERLEAGTPSLSVPSEG